MAKTQSQSGNITIKKEEEDVKPTLLLNGVRNTRTSSRIEKRRPSITNNSRLPAQQVKAEEDTDTKPLLQSTPKYSKCGPTLRISQEQINQLFHYIVNNNMSVYGASRKVNMTHASAIAYYKLYKNDPEKKIPLPRHHNSKKYTQEQIGNLIRYFNDDKMAVTEASAKAGMPYDSGYHYYKRYLKDPNHTIPIPRMKQSYTQDQKNEFIDYIVRDKTSINAASKKAKMHISAANYYYHKYFEKQNLDVPTPSHIATHKYYTQEQINQLISYITNDKMSIDAASRKANIPPSTARGCYRQYVKDNNIKLPVTRKAKAYTGDEINKLIGYIVDNKMSINAASKKANMSAPTGIKYYRQYLKEHHLDYPIQKVITQEQKNELIGYIVDTKMTIKAASKKANMCETTDHRYYQQYLNDNY